MINRGKPMHLNIAWVHHMSRAHMRRTVDFVLSHRIAFDIGPRSRSTLPKLPQILAATSIHAAILYAHDFRELVISICIPNICALFDLQSFLSWVLLQASVAD